MPRRKVLLITADQWRGDALSLLKHPAARTPNIDALAADGVTFLKHYTPAAPCGPARATLLTGLYPFVHRSIRNGTPLDARHTTLGLEARKAGRDPVLFGYTDSSVDPRSVAADDPRLRTYEGVLPGFRLVAALNSNSLDEWLQCLRDKGYVIPARHREIYRHEGSPEVMPRFSRAPARYRAQDSDTAFIADKVIEYTRDHAADNWFAHVVFLRPHPPLIAPTPYNHLIDAASVPRPVRRASPDDEASAHPFLGVWLAEMARPTYFESQVDVHALPEEDREAMRAVYFGLIAEVDAQVGRIIEHLKATGQFDDTLIIFTSDHGEMLGDHWCWGKGGWFDASNHVPLIIRDPQSPASARGLRVSAFTESVDLMPTILDWIGCAVPPNCNGHRLAPWLCGERPEQWRRGVFWEFDFRNPRSRHYETALGLGSDACTMNVYRDDRFKYVHFVDGPPLLYDLVRDPNEFRNLAGEPGFAATVADYARKLLSHRLLHCERHLANTMLGADGVTMSTADRATPWCLHSTD